MARKMLLAATASAFALMVRSTEAASSWATYIDYSDRGCGTTPEVLSLQTAENCTADACYFYSANNYLTRSCDADESTRFANAKEAFDDAAFVFLDFYSDQNACDELTAANVYPAWGRCSYISSTVNQSVIADVYANGSAKIKFYSGANCDEDPVKVYEAAATNLFAAQCIQDGSKQFIKVYSSASIASLLSDTDGSSDASSGSDSASSMSSGADGETIAGGVIGGFLVAAVLTISAFLALGWCRRQKVGKTPHSQIPRVGGTGIEFAKSRTPGSTEISLGTGAIATNSVVGLGPRHVVGLWGDGTASTARTPRDKVLDQKLVGSGSVGQISIGSFRLQSLTPPATPTKQKL